ncbi:hypothetical protein BpHYR1_040625 [Brachionus plicatilis]|uniref:Uncharacterized protein n=1 Tax=Brachionus plicatilis TaxID=10195 RepID=A0A3M7RZ28_BRAPC|nr:hypothetical protein BpHYR1_040625 [Brachionus plicatilis]
MIFPELVMSFVRNNYMISRRLYVPTVPRQLVIQIGRYEFGQVLKLPALLTFLAQKSSNKQIKLLLNLNSLNIRLDNWAMVMGNGGGGSKGIWGCISSRFINKENYFKTLHKTRLYTCFFFIQKKLNIFFTILSLFSKIFAKI